MATKLPQSMDQVDLRAKLIDLRDSLGNRWVRWNDWERQFIFSIIQELNNSKITVTLKQYKSIYLLWEKSLK